MRFFGLVMLFGIVNMSTISSKELVFPTGSNKTSEEQQRLRNKFDDFVVHHQKQYKDQEEYQKRFEIFVKNHEKIEKLNLEANQNGRNTTFAINQFSDLDSSENKGHMSEVPTIAANLSDSEFVKRVEKNLEKS